MKRWPHFTAVVFPFVAFCLAVACLSAAQYAPPPSVKLSEEVRKKIDERMDKLEAALRLFRRERVPDPILADIEVYLKAAMWITRYSEFYDKNAGDWTIEALERGLLRAGQVK